MPILDINKTAIAFKRLSGKAHTQQNLAVTEEGISSNVGISYSTVFGQQINRLPLTNGGLSALYSTDGKLEKIRFDIEIISDTLIGTNQSQGYRLKLPSSYSVSGALRAKFSGGTRLHTALGKLQIVSGIYGTLKPDGSTEFDPVLYQTNGSTVISKFDPIDWILDTYNGILFVQTPPIGFDVSASRPGFVEAYLYVGKYLDDVLINISGGSGTASLPVYSVQFNNNNTFSGSNKFIFTPSGSSLTLGTRSGSLANYSMSVGSGNTLTGGWSGMFGAGNTITQPFGFAAGIGNQVGAVNSVALNKFTFANGSSSFAGGEGTLTRKITTGGQASFNFSFNDSSQGSGEGAIATSSAILGGKNNNIANGNVGAAIIGGNSLKLSGSNYTYTTAVSNFAIFGSLSGGTVGDGILTINTSTKKIRSITQAQLLGSLSGTTSARGAVNSLQYHRGAGLFTGITEINVDPLTKSVSLGTRSGTNGLYTFTVGLSAEAGGNYSVAFGDNTTANGLSAFAHGNNTSAEGQYSHAEGQNSFALGIASHVQGLAATANGNYSHAGGLGDATKNILANGIASFNHSFNDTSQVVGHGAISNYSAILGGKNNYISATNTGATIIAGNTIKLSGSGYSYHTAITNLAIFGSLASGVSGDSILVLDSATKKVKSITQASIMGGVDNLNSANNGLTVVGRGVRLGGTLTGDTIISGSSAFQSSQIKTTGSDVLVSLIKQEFPGNTYTKTKLWAQHLGTASVNDTTAITEVAASNDGTNLNENMIRWFFSNNSITHELKLDKTGLSLNFAGTTPIFNYVSNYNSRFHPGTIVDARYVTGQTWSLLTGATNGLTVVGKKASLGGGLTSNTRIIGPFSLSLGIAASSGITAFSATTVGGSYFISTTSDTGAIVLNVSDSLNKRILRVSNNGAIYLNDGNAGGTAAFFKTDVTNGNQPTIAPVGTGNYIAYYNSQTVAGIGHQFTNGTITLTSAGTSGTMSIHGQTFMGSGSHNFTSLSIIPQFNSFGTANGVMRGIDYNPGFTPGGLANQTHYALTISTGFTGLGTRTPTARLHVAGGNTTYGPLKLGSGTLVATITGGVQNGLIEYDGTHLSMVIGSTRFQLDQQTGTGSTTFATNGLTKVSNVIKLGGSITGTTNIALSGNSFTITGSSNSLVNMTRVNFGSITATTNNLGITQSGVVGLRLINNTLASLGAQQISPPTIWEGQGWATGVNNSQSTKFIAYQLPVQAATNPAASLVFGSSVNGGAFTTRMSINSSGIFSVATISTISTNVGLGIRSQQTTVAGVGVQISNGAVNFTATSGIASHLGIGLVGESFAPTSGTASFNALLLANTINQTGGANGQITWININPTITASVNVTGYDYNPITPANISGTHLAFRATSGKVLIGGTGITSSTRVDIRGLGVTTNKALRIGTSANTETFNILDRGTANYITDQTSNFTTLSLVHVGYVTGLTSQRLATSTFSTYTGTTAPGQFVAKTVFNTYTGDTIVKQNLKYATGITLNLSNLEEKRFIITGATTGNILFATFTNAANVEVFTLDLSATTTINLTMPSTVRMQQTEVDASRWVAATKILSLTSGNYQLTFSYNNQNSLFKLNASQPYV